MTAHRPIVPPRLVLWWLFLGLLSWALLGAGTYAVARKAWPARRNHPATRAETDDARRA
jgi:hypothetical protein